MKIYVASSWRNTNQPHIVELLRACGHEVYDFRHPDGPETEGFSWSEIDTEWASWTQDQYIEALETPRAKVGFNLDFKAMKWADAFVLVMPCGRSAHLEAGWAVGSGKPTSILLAGLAEPELMYKMADLVRNDCELIKWARLTDRRIRGPKAA